MHRAAANQRYPFPRWRRRLRRVAQALHYVRPESSAAASIQATACREVLMMQYALTERMVTEPGVLEDDPIIAPLVREQLDALIGGVRDGGVGGPERAMMRAILQDAILCLVGEAAPAKERVRLAEEARCWVRSRSRAWVFAFDSVCDVLGIDADTARRKLLEMSDASRVVGEDDAPRGDRVLQGVRGLRRCGQRPRRAIHFMRERRRRRAVETQEV